MKNIFIKGRLFIINYLALFSILFLFTLIYTKGEIHLFVNTIHNPFFDSLMKYWTYLGDGVVLAVIILLFLFISFRYFFILLGSYAISGILSQVLKRLIFSDLPRPVKYFELHYPETDLYLVPGVHLHAWHSFPSGHTAAAFAVFFTLAMITKSKVIQVILYLLALGVSFSRIYLSQHFLMDVVAGSFIGMVSGWMCWQFITRSNAEWIDRPIQKLSVR